MKHKKFSCSPARRWSLKAIPALVALGFVTITMHAQMAASAERPTTGTEIRIDAGIVSVRVAIA